MEGANKTNIYYSPLRYPGGKNCIFPFVANLFYENCLIGVNYAEPYAGGSGLALRLLVEGYVERIYINDLDRAIYAIWFSILNRTEEFCEWIQGIDVSISNWRKYKKMQGDVDSLSLFEVAKSSFFLNRTNISGVIKGGVIGGKDQTGKYRMDARFNKVDLIGRIQKVAKLKDRIILSNIDGLTFISNLNRKREDIFIYLDPPYYQKGADLYMNFYSAKDHRKLSKVVHSLNKRWMVSYDNHDFIWDLYAEYRRVLYKLSQSASNRIGDEVLVFSDELRFDESLGILKSATSFERHQRQCDL